MKTGSRRNSRLDELARSKGWPGISAYCTALLRGEIEIHPFPGDSVEAFNIQENPLSRRESQVLARIVRGLSNKEIGLQLKISHQTVRHHVSSLLKKLGAKNKAEIARRYVRQVREDQDIVTRENFMDILKKVSRPVSRKESEVLNLARRGMNNDEIGLALGKNKKTVDTQLKAATGKLGISREQLRAGIANLHSAPSYLPSVTPDPKLGYCSNCRIVRLSRSDTNGICLDCREENGV